LFDTALRPWTYPIISLLVLATCMTPSGLPTGVRLRVWIVAVMTSAVYCVGIFLIFYLIWTPIDAAQVWGVQGRYFLPVLPALAIAISTAVNRSFVLPPAATALSAALLSGAASFESIIRVDWN
jgi:hypothetical protein